MVTNLGSFLSGKHVVVIGGGIAGLTFVAAIHHLWDASLAPPEITVFEEKTRQDSLKPDPYIHTIRGGTVDDGLAALDQLGLMDAVVNCSTPNSGIIRVWSDDWKQLATIEPKPYGSLPNAAIRITRQDLKRILIEEAEKTNATWQWGYTCVGAERVDNGKVRVTIGDMGAVATFTQDCDVLIAADGLHSRVRASLRPFDMKMQYAGANQIGGISYLSQGLPEPVNKDFGLQMSSGEGVCCIYTPFTQDTIGWALSRMGPEREPKGGSLNTEELEGLMKEALELGSMFNEPFKTIIEATDPTTAFIRPAKEKRAFEHDLNLGSVVFIGDANHALNCFEQLGANMSLKDGWDLAEQLCRNSSMKAAILAYDKLSIPRVEHNMNFSHERIKFGHSTGLLWKIYKHGMTVMRAFKKGN